MSKSISLYVVSFILLFAPITLLSQEDEDPNAWTKEDSIRYVNAYEFDQEVFRQFHGVFYISLGMSISDFGELNDELAANNYPTIQEINANAGLGFQFRIKRFTMLIDFFFYSRQNENGKHFLNSIIQILWPRLGMDISVRIRAFTFTRCLVISLMERD